MHLCNQSSNYWSIRCLAKNESAAVYVFSYFSGKNSKQTFHSQLLKCEKFLLSSVFGFWSVGWTSPGIVGSVTVTAASVKYDPADVERRLVRHVPVETSLQTPARRFQVSDHSGRCSWSGGDAKPRGSDDDTYRGKNLVIIHFKNNTVSLSSSSHLDTWSGNL